jgi:hypothetical protein
MSGNVSAETDAAGNLQPSKKKSNEGILRGVHVETLSPNIIA